MQVVEKKELLESNNQWTIGDRKFGEISDACPYVLKRSVVYGSSSLPRNEYGKYWA